jgi:hypothetical protein
MPLVGVQLAPDAQLHKVNLVVVAISANFRGETLSASRQQDFSSADRPMEN